MEEKIVELLQQRGPLIGSEIKTAVGGDGLHLWRTCKLSKELSMRTVGTRYMRLDRNVDGFARMSPSILREFLTYSVTGLKGDDAQMAAQAQHVIRSMEKISKAKLDLAYQVASGILGGLESEWAVYDRICIIIAGDIVYNMAHDVPRPERSSKRMVNGSDLDLVVILDDDLPEDLVRVVDDTIYKEKYGLLMMPHIREELDYIVKRMSRVRQQIQFDTFRHMVACKIMHEGTLLCGSERMFTAVKTLLRDSGVAGKIDKMIRQAEKFRKKAEAYLLYEDPEKRDDDRLSFFYPTEESEEFE